MPLSIFINRVVEYWVLHYGNQTISEPSACGTSQCFAGNIYTLKINVDFRWKRHLAIFPVRFSEYPSWRLLTMGS